MWTRTVGVFQKRLAWATVLLLFITGLAYAESPKEKLQGFLKLRAAEVVAGEPLVVTVGVKNVGDTPYVTTWAKSGIFRRYVRVQFTIITRANLEIPGFQSLMDGRSLVRRNPDFINKLGGVTSTILPGEAVSAKQTVPLVQLVNGRWDGWLEPGIYTIQAKITIPSTSETFMAGPETFTVKPLAPENQGILSIVTPELASVLQGQGHSREEDAAVAKAEELRKKSPRAPHRQYLDFQVFRIVSKREEKVAKAKSYLEEFPKSPYVDDVLWALANMEREAGEDQEAAAHLVTLLRDYPDSPLKQEAEELQKKLKDARERAAERKAAQEKNPTPSQD